MKPLVYFVDKADKDNYVLSKEELNKILEEVYQAGYKDGQYNGRWHHPNLERYIFGEPMCKSTETPYPREIKSEEAVPTLGNIVTCVGGK